MTEANTPTPLKIRYRGKERTKSLPVLHKFSLRRKLAKSSSNPACRTPKASRNKKSVLNSSLSSIPAPKETAKAVESHFKTSRRFSCSNAIVRPKKTKRTLFRQRPTHSAGLEILFADPDAEIVIYSLIGKGSNCNIYSCSVSGMICAMKEISLEFCANIDPFDEVRMLERLPQHKNLVRYFSHRQTPNTLQIFQQQYQMNLADLIQEQKEKKKPFALSFILSALSQIVSGLIVLHSCDIIHRDIKSQNIFVNVHLDGQYTFVLGDFDSAKSIDRQKASTTIGTPSFMAPEVFGDEGYTSSADVFSFGMLAFELMTLEMPYSDVAMFKIADQIIQGIEPTLPELPTEMKPLVMLYRSCTSSDPSYRPNTHQIAKKLGMLHSIVGDDPETNLLYTC